MSILKIISKTDIPYRTLIYILMFSGLALLFVSFHIYNAITWLPYAAIAIMGSAYVYIFYFVYKAGYKKTSLTGLMIVLILCILSVYVIYSIQPLFTRL